MRNSRTLTGVVLMRPTVAAPTDRLEQRLHLDSALGGLIVLEVATNLPEIAIPPRPSVERRNGDLASDRSRDRSRLIPLRDS